MHEEGVKKLTLRKKTNTPQLDLTKKDLFYVVFQVKNILYSYP